MYYGPEIMKQAGFGSDDNKASIIICSLPIFIVKILSTFVSLALIDSFGRRTIILKMLPLMALSMATVAVAMGLKNHTNEDQELLQVIGKWCVLIGILSYIVSYAIGMNSTPWVVNSEIYPLHLRGFGNSMATTTNWVSNFVVSLTFLTLMKHIPFGDVIGFSILSGMSILALIFTYFWVPETKGLRLSEVISLFVRNHNMNHELINNQH